MQQCFIQKPAKNQQAARRPRALGGQDGAGRQQQQAVLGHQQAGVRLFLFQSRLKGGPDRRRLARERRREHGSAQVGVVAAAVQNLPVAVEDKTEIQARILFQHAPVAQIGLDEGRIAVVGESVGVVPGGPIAQYVVQLPQFALNGRLRPSAVLQGLGPLQGHEGGLDNPVVHAPDDQQHDGKTGEGGQDGAEAGVHDGNPQDGNLQVSAWWAGLKVTVHSPRPLAGEGLGVIAAVSKTYPLTLALSPLDKGRGD